ncbi:Remorin, C-terminal [Cynara cardunculus var. scolymus]|uniref:Remorin, C-terminal n=1 Tax=Cynara cardunculus var. scolymus TaxID=59895 RepID=A0A103XVD3_CYNCS|nr:Remorin, C-terminal [Cynara cardunculus var. scolymus]
MDYEKINKNPPQGSGGGGGGGGGLSPAKLRSDSLENYRDVDVVSVLPERVTSSTADMLVVGAHNDYRSKDHTSFNSRIGSQDDGYLDYESGIDKVSASPFEFQKAERASHRKPMAPFSKPAPSKWDDAQKWIASPTSNRPKNEQSLKKNSHGGHGNRQPITKVVVEVPDQRLAIYEEPDTKQIDLSHFEENEGQYVVNLSRHDSSLSIQNATFVPPPSAARSVSMRDMGTEMTPIASQEPSRTGTPVRATTPSRSPSSSRPATPERTAPISSTTRPPNLRLESGSSKELSEKELQLKTRREIQALGTQLGKMNIAAWASKEDEDKIASSSMKTLGAEKQAKSAIEMRAAAWEDAEKAKYMARLMNKLAAARHKAEEKRAAAEAKRNRQAAKAEEQAEYIRKTGRIPSSFTCYRCCCC